MTDHTDNEYPANWHSGVGEANRPLDAGGYYLHLYYRVLPGSNQHVERFLELRIDTSDRAEKHHLELSYCTEDGEEVHRVTTLETETVFVNAPGDPEEQSRVEEEIHERAEELMADYADWTP